MSQRSDIRAAFEAGDILTRRDCYERFGCFEAGTRIKELRDEGMDIKSVKAWRDGKERPAWRLGDGKLRLFKEAMEDDRTE